MNLLDVNLRYSIPYFSNTLLKLTCIPITPIDPINEVGSA